jgi:hypothetical protein
MLSNIIAFKALDIAGSRVKQSIFFAGLKIYLHFTGKVISKFD